MADELLDLVSNSGGRNVGKENRQRHKASLPLATALDDECLSIVRHAVEYLTGASTQFGHRK
jgi:hypothetical protein